MIEWKVAKNVNGPWWWWASAALAIVGTLSAKHIYLSNLSFWLQRPDAIATVGAIAIAAMCLGSFIWMSARRASEIGSSPQALLTTFFILPIPFWIFALGSLPTKTDENPFPIRVLLRRLKVAGGITLATGAVALASYFYLTDREVLANSGSSSTRDTTDRARKVDPSFSNCYNKGVAYFKAIESYPRLRSTGEYVPDLVARRCERSRITFD